MNAYLLGFEIPLGAILVMLGVVACWFVAVPVAACVWAGRRFGWDRTSGTVAGIVVAVVLGGIAYSFAQLPWTGWFVYAAPIVPTVLGPVLIRLFFRTEPD